MKLIANDLTDQNKFIYQNCFLFFFSFFFLKSYRTWAMKNDSLNSIWKGEV